MIEPDPLATNPHVPAPSREFAATTPRARTTGAALAPPGPPTPVPGFEVFDELGRGGMGVVYRALQVALNREVALKVVLAATADRAEAARFLAEAEAVAAVAHPNVVQVYECGEWAGRPYMALEFLPGGTLAGRLEAEGALGARAAAELLARVARGVAAAHAQGIVHRDLKPANVLFGAEGEPKVADFGLAKRAAHDLTATQAVMGTPAYMSPEQAEGRTKFVGPQADVWALGAVLFECATGQRPFRGTRASELLAAILTSEPQFPRADRRFPRDLQLICRKCLEKDPAERYPTAAELADDLERFARGEPISVRPAGPLERAAKWARRKPTAATAVLLALIAAVAGGFGTVAALERRNAERAAGEAETERERADGQRQQAETARAATATALQREQVARSEADRQKVNFEEVSAARAVDLAHREWQNGNVGRAAQMLDAVPDKFRAWEWNYVRRLCARERFLLPIADAGQVALSPDGSRLLAFTILYGPNMKFTQRFALFDLTTKKELPTPELPVPGTEVCTYRPDPKVPRFVFWGPDPGAKGKYAAHVIDPCGPRVVTVVRGIPAERASSWAVAISADGTRLLALTQDAKARVWDATTGALVATLDGPFAVGPQVTEQVSLSADGSLAGFANNRANRFRLIEVTTGKVRAALPSPAGGVRTLLYLPGGRVLLQPYEGDAVIHDPSTAPPSERPLRNSAESSDLALSPDGTRMAAGSPSGRVRVWDTATGAEVLTLVGARGPVRGVAWSPDGKHIATGGTDRIARVWSAETGELLNTLRGADRDVHALSFGPKGALVTAALGGAAVFDMTAHPEFLPLGTQSSAAEAPRFAPDGSVVCYTEYGANPSRLFDTATGVELCRLSFGAHFTAPDRVLTLHPSVRVWHPRTGEQREQLISPPLQIQNNLVVARTLASDGRRGVFGPTLGLSKRIDVPTVLYDQTTGKEIATLVPAEPQPPKEEYRSRVFVFDPNGKWVSALLVDRSNSRAEYQRWDAVTGRLLHTRPYNLPGINWAAFPAGANQFRLSALIERNKQFDALSVLIDPRTGDELARLEVPRERGKFLAFSPDGARALIAAHGGELRIFNVKLGQDVLALPAHPEGSFEGVGAAEFSPDGTRIVTTANGRPGAKVWDGRPLAPVEKPK